MRIKIKKLHENAQLPKYNLNGDAGADLVATSISWTGKYIEYGVGFSMEIPEGYAGFIFPRSSISKTALALANAVAVIDSGYRGEIKLRFKDYNRGNPFIENLGEQEYKIGDRIGQLIILPVPKLDFIEVVELSDTDRGNQGFGSSGN